MRCFFDNTTDAWDFAVAMGASKEFKVTDYGLTHMAGKEEEKEMPYIDIEKEEQA